MVLRQGEFQTQAKYCILGLGKGSALGTTGMSEATLGRGDGHPGPWRHQAEGWRHIPGRDAACGEPGRQLGGVVTAQHPGVWDNRCRGDDHRHHHETRGLSAPGPSPAVPSSPRAPVTRCGSQSRRPRDPTPRGSSAVGPGPRSRRPDACGRKCELLASVHYGLSHLELHHPLGAGGDRFGQRRHPLWPRQVQKLWQRCGKKIGQSLAAGTDPTVLSIRGGPG